MAMELPSIVHGVSMPVTDVISQIALTQSADDRHRIYYRSGGDRRSLTLAELDRAALRVACHLHQLGVRRRDRIGIMAPNRIEWVLLDLGVLKTGAVTAGIEPGRHEPQDVVDDYGLKFLFAEGAATGDTVLDIGVVQSWADDVAADAVALPPRQAADPADICAIKQTSGSTGVPKGIEATTASVNASLAAVQEMFGHRDGDNLLVFLAVRFLQQRYWIYSAMANHHDVTLADRVTAIDVAQETSPTVVMGVPGFYEQLKQRLEARSPLTDLAARRDAIQAELGGRIRYLWTGSAPAGRAMLSFFNDCGVPLYEGYGLNETCIVSKNHPGAVRVGSVGKVLPHKRIRFDSDGILIVGGSYPVNVRYTWSAPGASEKVYLPTGEVKTFDIGHVDEDGFLYIDGRVDDIVTLSSALNILVPLVEEKLRELPDVHDCAVFGDGKPFLSAVISPAMPDIDRESLASKVMALNRKMRHEQRIYAVVVAEEEFSMDNGLLNAQYKLKRADIGARYAGDLALVYTEHNIYNDGTLGDVPILVMPARTTAAAGHRERL